MVHVGGTAAEMNGSVKQMLTTGDLVKSAREYADALEHDPVR